MPTYAYKCTNCGHRFEKEQRITESPLQECPVCGGHIRRVITQVGVVFKGTGFYVTDNRNGSHAKAKSEKKSETAETSTSTSSSTESGASSSADSTASSSTTTSEKTAKPPASTAS